MCGIGLFYGLLWRMAGTNPQKPLRMLLYVLVSIPGMLDMPEAVTVYGGILSQFLLFSVIFYVTEMGRGRLATS
jgi:predicted membrane channel-forming protein YqfA (hemolysin III family)